MSADLDALDRGLVDAGLIAAEALARVEVLEARLAALFTYMGAEAERAGIAPPPQAAPARRLRLVKP